MKKRDLCLLALVAAFMLICGLGWYGSWVAGSAATSLAVAGIQESWEIVTVRPATETMSRQRLPYFVGISEATSGAKGISMNLVVTF